MATQLAIVWARLTRRALPPDRENHFRENRARAGCSALKRIVLPRIVPQASGSSRHRVASHVSTSCTTARDPDSVTVFPNTVDVEAYGRRVDESRTDVRRSASASASTPTAVVVTHVSAA